MGERALIAAIEEALGRPGGRVLRGPGDDAAVVRAEGVAVTSVDVIVEGTHFERATHSHADVGHKALAVALSDLAAMGASPGEAYVGLTLDRETTHDEALALVTELGRLAARSGSQVAGGDVVVGAELAVAVTATGWAASESELVFRAGARAGDLVGVSGALGGSGAGLLLLGGVDAGLEPELRDRLLERHRRPQPRLALGQALAAAGASAMIDVSDGVATDAAHLAERSGVRIELGLAELPLEPGVEAVARAAGHDPLEHAAAAGEDFELLFCAPPERRAALERAGQAVGLELVWIGRCLPGCELALLDRSGRAVALAGHEHPIA